MRKLDSIKCPVPQKLTPMEALHIIDKKQHDMDEELKALNKDMLNLFCTLYNPNFSGVGNNAKIFIDKDCHVPISYEQLLHICETYTSVRVANGTRVYYALGYTKADNKVSLIFPHSVWEEYDSQGNKILVAGFPSISLYTDGNGNTYEYYNVKNSVPL